AAIHDDTPWLTPDKAAQPDGQFRIVGDHRLYSDQNRRMHRPKLVDLFARFGSGDPAALPGRGGDLAVQGGGELEGDPHASDSSASPSSLRNWAKSIVWRKS